MKESCCVEEGDDGLSEISLRPFDLSDVNDFMVWATDEQVSRFFSWNTYTSRDDALNYIKYKVIPHPWFRAICLKNRPIGSISVTQNSGNDRCRGALAYAVASKYWGQGIATQALKMIAGTIFSECPHLERLEAVADVQNLGSQRVLEKAGFTKECVLRKYFILKGSTRDVVIYSLLSTDPKLD